MATAAFELSTEPVDRAWYSTLEAISGVAADIGGVSSTHINHLTPRVLDIDELYRRMSGHGITMIDSIQGPPRWAGPDVLLRQTSFQALAEPRTFAEPDGTISTGALRVRFGEVEARGIALTPPAAPATTTCSSRSTAGLPIGAASAPTTPATYGPDRCRTTRPTSTGPGSASSSYRPADDATHAPTPPAGLVDQLVESGAVLADPIVYEDFLPRSAAGIFQSNLADVGTRTDTRGDEGGELSGDSRDLAWMSGMLEREVADPMDLYAAERARSLKALADRLGTG